MRVRVSTPYRDPRSLGPIPTGGVPCDHCGSLLSPFARVCPSCEGRLERARCTACFGLQRHGSSSCERCGEPMALEPDLEPCAMPCPACKTPLETSPHLAPERLECGRCGGVFVSNEVLAEWLARAEERGSPATEHVPAGVPDEVHYRACPRCGSSMNRVNFGKVSGVIVDACRLHGIWFDGGELPRALAFAASGGFERTRARLQQEAVEERQKLAAAAAEVAAKKAVVIRTRREAFIEMIEVSQKLGRLWRE